MLITIKDLKIHQNEGQLTMAKKIKKQKKSAKDSINKTKKSSKGRPQGPEKKPLPVRLPVDLLNTIRENSGGNLSYFTEQVFREYFRWRNVEIK